MKFATPFILSTALLMAAGSAWADTSDCLNDSVILINDLNTPIYITNVTPTNGTIVGFPSNNEIAPGTQITPTINTHNSKADGWIDLGWGTHTGTSYQYSTALYYSYQHNLENNQCNVLQNGTAPITVTGGGGYQEFITPVGPSYFQQDQFTTEQ